MKMNGKIKRHTANSGWKVLLNVPNLIGHVRLLLLISFVVNDERNHSKASPVISCLLLATSILLDVLDGIAARRLNQCSQFGYLYDIFLDCMAPVAVYGQCHRPACKFAAGVFMLACLFWGFLTMDASSSWKRGDRPQLWPASAMVDANGSFSNLGNILWYFGYFGFLTLLFALDRNMISTSFSTLFVMVLVFIAGALNTASLLEYIHFYLHSTLLMESEPSPSPSTA